jgi:hypothetical protein
MKPRFTDDYTTTLGFFQRYTKKAWCQACKGPGGSQSRAGYVNDASVCCKGFPNIYHQT